MEVVMKCFYLDIPLMAGKDDGIEILRRQYEFNDNIFSFKVGDIVQTRLFTKPLQIQQIIYNFTAGIVRLLVYPISCGNNKERKELITLLKKDGWLCPYLKKVIYVRLTI
jgi:hypothetical protein